MKIHLTSLKRAEINPLCKKANILLLRQWCLVPRGSSGTARSVNKCAWSILTDFVRWLLHKLRLISVGARMNPNWLSIALAEIGNERVPFGQYGRQFYEHVGLTGVSGSSATPSKSSLFINWCFDRVGGAGSGSVFAQSWIDWGEPLDSPVRGCIVLHSFSAPNEGKLEVGLYLRRDEMRTYVLGVNQACQASSYPVSNGSVNDFRWPAAISRFAAVSMSDLEGAI